MFVGLHIIALVAQVLFVPYHGDELRILFLVSLAYFVGTVGTAVLTYD